MGHGLQKKFRKKSWAPSSADRWSACPGSINLLQFVPHPPENVFAKLGTSAHHLLQKSIESQTYPDRFLGQTLRVKPRYGEDFSYFVDQNMVEAVGTCFQFVNTERAKHRDTEVLTEKNLWLFEKINGTADIIIKSPEKLIIIDYKHGEGVGVSAKKNKQLAFYALAANEYFGMDFARIEMHIIQPRLRFGKTHDIWVVKNPKKFVKKWSEKFQKWHEATKTEKNKLVVGEHCRWCEAKLVCPGMLGEAQMLAGRSKKEVGNLTPHQITELLKKKKSLVEFLNLVEESAKNRALGGEKIPGYKVVSAQGRSSRTYLDIQRAKKWLLNKCRLDKADIFTEPEILSVPKIEALLTKKQKEKFNRKYVLKTNGTAGFALVPKSDSRPGVTTAKQDFLED